MKVCKKCGKDISKIKKRIYYCDDCYIKICKLCGKKFKAYNMRMKFCCKEHALKYNVQKRRHKEKTVKYDKINGYNKIKINGKWIREHRYIMEKHLGRKLKPNEDVHHINKNKIDNRVENLQIVQRNHHFGEVECPHCLKKFKIK